MCDFDDFPGPDIDPNFFKDEELPEEEPLYNPFYEPAPGEDVDGEWDGD